MVWIQFSVAFVIIIMILLIYIFTRSPDVRGWWEAPKKFCDKAGIKSASFYFADNVSIYIDDNEYLCKYSVKNNKLYIEDSPLPTTLRIEINKGLMLLYDDDILYMELYRNNMLSDGCI